MSTTPGFGDEGKHPCDGKTRLDVPCANVVLDTSDHCEAGHPNRVRSAETVTTFPRRDRSYLKLMPGFDSLVIDEVPLGEMGSATPSVEGPYTNSQLRKRAMKGLPVYALNIMRWSDPVDYFVDISERIEIAETTLRTVWNALRERDRQRLLAGGTIPPEIVREGGLSYTDLDEGPVKDAASFRRLPRVPGRAYYPSYVKTVKVGTRHPVLRRAAERVSLTHADGIYDPEALECFKTAFYHVREVSHKIDNNLLAIIRSLKPSEAERIYSGLTEGELGEIASVFEREGELASYPICED